MTDRDELVKRLQDRIPFGYWRGIDISNGWLDIVDRLDKAIVEIDPNYVLYQVKEKFGGLRFYTGDLPEEANRLIVEAEEESYRTCEECGKQDNSVKTETTHPVNHWIRSLCSDDREKWKQECIDRDKKLEQN